MESYREKLRVMNLLIEISNLPQHFSKVYRDQTQNVKKGEV
jgi:hypothetical protein